MSINILKRVFVMCSIIGVIITAAQEGAPSRFIAQARETSQETEAQQFAKDEVNRKRNELRNLLETRRNEFKNRMRDQRVIRISDSINQMNARQTEQMLRIIGRIDDILQRATARISNAEQRGVNMPEITPKIQEASRIINEARDLVVSQAGKIYSIDGSSREVWSAEARRIREQFRGDIKNVKTKVEEARTAVVEIIQGINRANNQ